MAEKEPKMQSTPKGTPIPIPTRGDFDRNLGKVLKAPKPPKRVPPANPRGRPSFNPKKHPA
jgi:hypothetical protein